MKEIKDQLGNVRVLEYDGLGRPLHDRMTTLGTGVDSTVRRISRTYESRGNVEKLTSYNSATVGSGTIINEVKYKYNSFGQLEREFQSHGGAVNDTSAPFTPNVQHGYETGGTKNSLRRKQLVGERVRFGPPDLVAGVLNELDASLVAGEEVIGELHVRYAAKAVPREDQARRQEHLKTALKRLKGTKSRPRS